MQQVATKQDARSRYAASLASSNVVLPLRYDEDNLGTIVDASGTPICVVDVNRERPDTEVLQIALRLVLGVNTCGGFTLEQTR